MALTNQRRNKVSYANEMDSARRTVLGSRLNDCSVHEDDGNELSAIHALTTDHRLKINPIEPAFVARNTASSSHKRKRRRIKLFYIGVTLLDPGTTNL